MAHSGAFPEADGNVWRVPYGQAVTLNPKFWMGSQLVVLVRGRMHDTILSTSPRLKSTYASLAVRPACMPRLEVRA